MKLLRRNQSFAAIVAVLALLMTSNVVAQDGLLLDDNINVTDSEVQTVEDSFTTNSEMTAEQKKVLADRKAQMDKKHLQELRLKEQKRIANQMKAAIAAKKKNKKKVLKKRKKTKTKRIARKKRKVRKDKVRVAQAARKKSVAKKPIKKKQGILNGRDLKVIPFGGVANIKKDTLDLSTKINTGIVIEGELTDKFTVGVGFRYTTLEYQDNTPNISNFGFGVFNTTSTGREVEYRGLNFEVNSKYFLARKKAFIRPFVGLGLGYNRNNLKYADGGQIAGNGLFNSNFEDVEYSSTMMTGSLMAGAEANLSDTFGVYLGARYTRGLTDSSTSSSTDTTNADQQELNANGAIIDDANILGFNAGLVVKF